MGIDLNDERVVLKQMQDVFLHYPTDSTVFREWAETIEEDARIICNDPKGERVKFTVADSSIYLGKIAPSTLACIIRAIRQNLARMPDNLNMWYLAFLRYLEIQ